ncbi:MAG: respiratory nitrate reductase subunit gamma [Desulfarculaceae bacterium]|nr:respiratory nitrate reductase subunit gamma [Desulfarculaceae bacterium]MCF8071161.1 respiratory nitrate reductase subunit gamma [Desulfarculaceae bacterium]MCF8101236.1 respiratory nitrate reductase subunit gamma [Desulfarculaceae bacterium]MCF8115215.1 respiratory nitrate reductase subunit gamma [Desulfarculaceae bacterium]
MRRCLPIGGLLLAALLLALVMAAPVGAASAPAATACLQCHASEGLADGKGQDLGPHADMSCLECHQGAEKVPHENLEPTSCLNCHQPHNEEATGDLHVGVSCQACHFGGEAGPHALAPVASEASCQRCHFVGNQVGAPAAVLPPKSALCLACHTATLSLADWPSRIALALLVLGLLGSLGFWLSGGGEGPAPAAHHQRAWRMGPALSALLLDGLLQRRLWRLSRGRWLVHALIFLPFAARLAWALAALVLGRWEPGAGLTQAMLAKNHPATALFFDLTGLMVLAGGLLAMARRWRRGPTAPGLPRPDWPALALLGLIVLSGFITEAARMSLTGYAGPAWAFVGAALSRLFTPGPGLQTAYAYLWYAHAICYAAFVAYLPFSRLRHILLAPLWLAVKAGGETKHGK